MDASTICPCSHALVNHRVVPAYYGLMLYCRACRRLCQLDRKHCLICLGGPFAKQRLNVWAREIEAIERGARRVDGEDLLEYLFLYRGDLLAEQRGGGRVE